jgi:hypothetical protein
LQKSKRTLGSLIIALTLVVSLTVGLMIYKDKALDQSLAIDASNGLSNGVYANEVTPESYKLPDPTTLSQAPQVSGPATDGHQLVAKTETHALYLMADKLSIIVEDLKTGSKMYSTMQEEDETINTAAWKTFVQSGITLEFIKGTNLVPERVDLVKGAPQVTLGYLENGFVARVYYEELSLGYDVAVTLDGSGLVVEVPESGIIEATDDYKIGNLYVFPFLGYSRKTEQEGYMFIPDGTGALIYLEDNNNKFKQPYSEKIYGVNAGIDDPYVVSLFNGRDPVNPSEKIIAPIYGKVHTDDAMALFAIVESGQASATIEAYPNGAITQYDWITSFFVYRQVYNQLTSQSTGTMPVRQKERNHFDIRIHYEFLSGDAANYVEMAKFYRSYLLDSQKISQGDTTFNMKLDFYGGEQENWLLFKRMVPMTTTEQVEEILEQLESRGVTDILGVYQGWQKKGVFGGLPVTAFNPERQLGGKSGMEQLLQTAKDLEMDFYLYTDPLRMNPDSNAGAARQSMKKLNKRLFNEEVYKLVYRNFYYLLPERSLSYMEKGLDSFEKAGVNHLYLTGITNQLFSYLQNNEIYDRQDTQKTYETAINLYDQQFKLILDQPFDIYWQHADAVANIPTETSKYVFTDEEIPFFPIVLGGIIPMYSEYGNFQANQETFRLKLIEQGIYPSFLLTYEDPSLLINTNSNHIYSSKFEFYEEMLVTYHEEMKALSLYRDGALIDGYVKENGVSKVSYDNGRVLYVNFNDDAVTIDGITIDAMSYKVGEN